MIESSVTDARNRFSALLEQVKAGETVVILERGRPIAHLGPPTPSMGASDDARLARLEAAGLVTKPAGRPRPLAEIYEACGLSGPVPIRPGPSVHDMIQEDREARWRELES